MKTVRRLSIGLAPQTRKKRVAAYARVSNSQLHHSLSNQVSYYNAKIQQHPDWELAGIYYDEGLSGRFQKNRPNFLALLKACEAGEVDLILTKSISRFGRNTVELLKTVRRLKELRIGVLFEKEGIDSLSADGEFLLSLLASVAQEEASNEY